MILVAVLSFISGALLTSVVAFTISYKLAQIRIAYEKSEIEKAVADYFRNIVCNSPSSKIPFDVVDYNADICRIVRNGGAE